MPNHYETLGISPSADLKDIKQAFKQIAVLNHPDKGGDEVLYHNAREAYDTLRDVEKRLIYDKQLNYKKEPSKPARVRKGSDLKIRIKITLAEIAAGIEKSIAINRKGMCPDCLGTGSLNKVMKQCPECRGLGIDMVSLVFGPERYCRQCKGYATIPDESNCPKCRGTGLINEVIHRNIKIQAQDRDGVVVMQGAGNYCQGGVAGDLIVELDVKRDDTYVVDGLNLKRTLKITPAQAVLGDSITIEVFGTPVKVNIPSGTPNGYLIEKEGFGVQAEDKAGNLILRIEVCIPVYVPPQEADLYRKILKLEKGDKHG